ncbi:PadR family transcriptional regulator [Brevibacillus choshinensis]|uniref:PadR family transcriptional regulator n=1 Tax=Brevibacillus choshinensis TaxID=54911 RepID=A0ABR5N0P3_BRECH|nr:DinB family protein [Brevibacillus choshinensis]KQL44021.1 PadR family transcriptional regulator [Brevibacillus choshinensis]
MDKFEEYLIKTREQLLNEFSFLSFDEFNRRFEMEKWSIAQVCHHLFITETLFAKAIVFGLDQKKPTDTEHIPIQFVSDRSNKIQAPKISEPSSEPFQVLQIIQLLNDSRNKLMYVLSKIDDKSVLRAIAVKHPVFGNLPLDQWVELLHLHEQRHIEQIKDLKALC